MKKLLLKVVSVPFKLVFYIGLGALVGLGLFVAAVYCVAYLWPNNAVVESGYMPEVARLGIKTLLHGR